MSTTVTDTQRAILQAAAARPDRLAAPPAPLPAAPRGAVARATLKAGLLEPAGAPNAEHQAIAWRLDGAAVLLRVTGVGLAAVGAGAEDAPRGAQGAPLTADEGPGHDTPAGAEAAQGAPTGLQEGIHAAHGEAAGDMPDAAHTGPRGGAEAEPGSDDPAGMAWPPTAAPARGAGLRDAARRVLAAWDDEAGERGGLREAIEGLRAALPQPRVPRAPRAEGAPRGPRAGTKQEAVLALLRRRGGAGGPEIAGATGWRPHTVRGFLAGLKKRGVEVLVHKRVRQVGPGKDGARGSYTVYRIAGEPAG